MAKDLFLISYPSKTSIYAKKKKKLLEKTKNTYIKMTQFFTIKFNRQKHLLCQNAIKISKY